MRDFLFSLNDKPEQTDNTEEKIETKSDDKPDPKPGCSKQEETIEKPGRNSNNDSGNCYW